MGGWRVVVPAGAVAMALAACGTNEEASPPPRSAGQAAAEEMMVMWRATLGTGAGSRARYDIVAIDAKDRRLRVLTPALKGAAQPLLFDRPSWSPDGRQIAFTVELDGDPAAPFRTVIYVMNADGSGMRRLTRSETALFPVWSPDGRTIAFAKRASSQSRSLRELLSTTIWTVDTDGSDERELVPSSGFTADTPGAWSPDGESLAFTRRTYTDPERGLQTSDAIYVVGGDGSGLHKLVEQGSEPAWSPDGRLLAFVSDRDRNGELAYGDRTSVANELYVADADGSSAKRLTTTRDLNERTPAWSPDGTRIAYTLGEEFENAEATSVLVVEADGDCPTKIAADPSNHDWYANAVWRPANSRSRFVPTCS